MSVRYENIHIVRFSPTGGTAAAADQVAQALGGGSTVFDVTGPQAGVRPHAFGPDELVVFAAPVYAGRIPAVEGLFARFTGSGTPCVLVLAYGNRHYDEAVAQLKAQVEGQGFVCVGAIAPITHHIFAPGLCDDRPNGEDQAEFARFAAAVKERIAAGGGSVQVPGDPHPEPKAAVYVPRTLDESRCVGCGLCSAGCPTGALRPDRTVETTACISCMHCVSLCPHRALAYTTPAPLLERLTTLCAAPRPVEWFA